MPCEIEFSDHCLTKMEVLKAHGVDITTEVIAQAVRFPDKTDVGYKGRLIAQKVMDVDHVLRVVYEAFADKVRIVTVYPGRRSRYEKD